MSLVETVTSVAVGFVLTLVLQAIFYPLFGIHTSWATNLWLTLIFTLASIARGYVLRRMFEGFQRRGPSVTVAHFLPVERDPRSTFTTKHLTRPPPRE